MYQEVYFIPFGYVFNEELAHILTRGLPLNLLLSMQKSLSPGLRFFKTRLTGTAEDIGMGFASDQAGSPRNL